MTLTTLRKLLYVYLFIDLVNTFFFGFIFLRPLISTNILTFYLIKSTLGLFICGFQIVTFLVKINKKMTFERFMQELFLIIFVTMAYILYFQNSLTEYQYPTHF
jgi:hypothetical protein